MTLDRSICFPAAVGILLFISNLSYADTAILVALQSEQSALSREVRIVGQPVEIAQHRISIGYHKGEKMYIVRTGAGNLNSAMVTQALLTRYHIDRVISIGVAGYIGEEGGGTTEILRQAQDDNAKSKAEPVRIGDVFIATEVVNHQEGKETPGGFEAKEPSAISDQLPHTTAASRPTRLSAEYLKKCEALQGGRGSDLTFLDLRRSG